MINYKKTILLTGAGFSKNFGGYLSKELWSKIFNNPDLDQYPAIKEKLKSNFDFESVYAEILEDKSMSSGERIDFQQIIINAYVDMDNMLGQYCSNNDDPHQINFGGVGQFLGLFAGIGNETGIHFTLNQDLFLERRVGRRGLGLGTNEYKNYLEAIDSKRIDSSKRVKLPDQDFIDLYKKDHLNAAGDLFYVKLHGSLGWWSDTGSKQMVLGNNKLLKILKEPLLKWYFEIFEEVLYGDGVKLFVVGYSFNDEHINKIILKGIKEHGLKLYIIAPTDPEKFKNKLIGKPENSSQLWEEDKDGKDIWNAVVNIFPYKLSEIFPINQSITDKKEDLFKAVRGG